jgi:two-component system sensor histidine kinase HydH
LFFVQHGGFSRKNLHRLRRFPIASCEIDMTSSLSIRVLRPSIFVGLLVLVGSILSLRYLYLLQSTSAKILSENVVSLEAAQELEIHVRQLRFHNLLYLLDPQRERLKKIEEDEERFEHAMKTAKEASSSPEELRLAELIEEGYLEFKREQAVLRDASEGKVMADAIRAVDSRPVRSVVEPSRRLFALNRNNLAERAERNRSVSREAFLAMLFLGVVGPLAGLVAGFNLARGLRKSIYRLSVQVRGMAQQLDRDLGSIDVIANGDLETLETQIQQVMAKLEQATQLMQQQQRELLRAEQLSQVGQLAAGVAHEIRNPLTGIKLLVDAALRPASRRALAEPDLRLISREVRRMEHSVQTLLDFARLPDPHPQPCEVGRLIDDAWELVKFRCDQQKVSVADRRPETALSAIVDPGQFKTVLVNLLLNALDAMPDGGELLTELSVPSEDTLQISVSDSGPGIAPSVASRLFVPFATTKANGTGLGLFLSRKIVEEHGGTLEAANREPRGACFTLRMPVQGVSA